MTVKIPQITMEDVDDLRGFIRTTVEKIGCKGVVVGLSGGIDSATVTKLCADALGPSRVLNVFMPSRVTPAEDYKTTSELSSLWGTEYRVVDIQPAVDALAAVLLSGRDTPLERGNISARCRMIVLYNLAKKRDYVVMGTSNQSEIMMGYFTKFGDGACDVTPLANLYKTEVRQMARLIGVPEAVVAKPPSAGLWEGQTDEKEMGIRYEDLDGILYDMEQDRTDQEIAVDTGLPADEVARIRRQVRSMEHKRLPAVRPSEFRSDPSSGQQGLEPCLRLGPPHQVLRAHGHGIRAEQHAHDPRGRTILHECVLHGHAHPVRVRPCRVPEGPCEHRRPREGRVGQEVHKPPRVQRRPFRLGADAAGEDHVLRPVAERVDRVDGHAVPHPLQPGYGPDDRRSCAAHLVRSS